MKLFINDLDSGTGYRLSMFVDDTKLGGPVDTPDGCAAIWKDLNRYKKWAYRNLRKFNHGECQVLHLSMNNPMHQCRLEASWLESSSAEKDLVVLVDSKLTRGQQCAVAAMVSNILLGCTRKTYGSREMILLLNSLQ